MTLPPVDYCVACEDIRVEINSKAMLFGFYGASPHIEVYGVRQEAPLKLMFMASFGRTVKKEAILKGSILDENGNELAATKSLLAKFDLSYRYNMGFRFLPFTPPKSGEYTFVIKQEASEVYRTKFLIFFTPAEVEE